MGVLEGITVVELSIAIAAPSCCRALAFHGADVIKLESRTNPDVARLFGSAWATGMDAGPYMDTSPYLAEMSANKRSVGLELKHPAARRAAFALIATADVFVTNYSTPAVRALGLGPDDLAAVNPAPRLRRPPGVRIRSRPAVLRVPRLGPEPGPARRPRRADRLPRPGARRHRHDRPARLLRRAPRARRRAHRARAPRPHGRGHVHRHRPVRDDGVQPRPVPARPRAHRRRASRVGEPVDVAGAAGLLPLRRRRRLGRRDRPRRRAVGRRRRPARGRRAPTPLRHRGRAARAPRRARRAHRGVDERPGRQPMPPSPSRPSAWRRARSTTTPA